MVFSSISFLFYFIPVTVLLYYMVSDKLKNTVLLLSSIVFYAWGEPRYLIVMTVMILQGYFFGICIEKYSGSRYSKAALMVSVILSIGTLCYFKYVNFLIENINKAAGMTIPLLKITLPIGISFYTFQLISYVLDVYWGRVTAQKNVINFGAYVSMFPQLIAGPIVRYADIKSELVHKKKTDGNQYKISEIAYGIRRFVIGLSKKILVANVLGELAAVYKKTDDDSILFVWLYAIACTLQLYFDFSGYSDMAIGLGRILGFTFPENFNYPYISGSITEFWRRWHISLGSWFRDYLYIPLGGNRVSKARWIFNIAACWLATGLWHGAAWNFIIWGLLFALLLIIEKLFLLKYLEKTRLIKYIYVLLWVIVSFIIFDAASISTAFAAICKMVGFYNIPFLTTASLYYLKSYAVIIIIAIIGATPYPKIIWNQFEKKFIHMTNAAEPLGIMLLLVLCTAFLIDGSFNPFLYFRF